MIVADTNIVIPLLLEHEKREDAVSLFSRDPDWHLPDWWQIELANVLRNYHHAGLFTGDEVELLLVHGTQLFPPENTHPVDLAETLRLACERNISAYDARFIALARAFGVKLITEDARLRKACPDDTFSLDQMLAAR